MVQVRRWGRLPESTSRQGLRSGRKSTWKEAAVERSTRANRAGLVLAMDEECMRRMAARGPPSERWGTEGGLPDLTRKRCGPMLSGDSGRVTGGLKLRTSDPHMAPIRRSTG
ncbi:hypothetical protein NDU88_000842 [Pleurodeles waltl]|uniref:Uncharacterized protein n=1 Tax=Pleurodeles waltl TaxID=8319 RepID=A0AAV7VXP7_PLEWA|nr:hypothetical protein NDU88_000842 [Pleurodeles waltl]